MKEYPRVLAFARFSSNNVEPAVVANLDNAFGAEFPKGLGLPETTRLVIIWFKLTAAKITVRLKPGLVVEKTMLLTVYEDANGLHCFLRFERERTSCYSPPLSLVERRS